MRHEIVCRLTSCLSTDEITDRDTNDDRDTGTRAMPPKPPPLQQLYIYIYKNKLSVCLSSDFRCVDWRHCKDWAVCVMKLIVDWRHVCQLMKFQTGTQMTTGTRGYREYKWRPGTSKKNYRLGHREYKWRPGHSDTTTKGTTGVQGRYINDDRDTGIVRREITDRDTGKRMTTGMLGHREYKWRPWHSKRKYRLGHRDTNEDRNTGNINDDQDTGTQLQGGCQGAQGDI